MSFRSRQWTSFRNHQTSFRNRQMSFRSRQWTSFRNHQTSFRNRH